jgi:hypothetical protein
MDKSVIKRPGPIHEPPETFPDDPGDKDGDEDHDESGDDENLNWILSFREEKNGDVTHASLVQKRMTLGLKYSHMLSMLGWEFKEREDSMGHTSISMSVKNPVSFFQSSLDLQKATQSQNSWQDVKTKYNGRFSRFFKHLRVLFSEFVTDMWETFAIIFNPWSRNKCKPIHRQKAFNVTTLYTKVSYSDLGSSFAAGDFDGDGLEDLGR